VTEEAFKKDFENVLSYHFQNKKFKTVNRSFFEAVAENLDENYKFSTPWTVSWQINSNCNLRCKHCFFEGDDSLYNTDGDLCAEELSKIAQNLHEKFNTIAVSLTGGETLLCKSIFDLLKQLKNSGIIVSLQTNGTLLTREKAQKLASILNKETDFVQISLDGSCAEIYDAVRGKGNYEKAINAIKYLTEQGIRVNVNCTPTSYNDFDLFELYKLCDECNVSKFSISAFVPCFEEQTKMLPDFETIICEASKIINSAKSTFFEFNYRFYDFVQNSRLRALADDYIKEKKPPAGVVWDLICHKHNTLFINSKGKVYLCFGCEACSEPIGDCKKDSLEEIWNNRFKNIFFNKRLAKEMKCKACKYFLYCKGGCMASAYKKYKDINAPDGLCRYAKEIFQN